VGLYESYFHHLAIIEKGLLLASAILLSSAAEDIKVNTHIFQILWVAQLAF